MRLSLLNYWFTRIFRSKKFQRDCNEIGLFWGLHGVGPAEVEKILDRNINEGRISKEGATTIVFHYFGLPENPWNMDDPVTRMLRKYSWKAKEDE